MIRVAIHGAEGRMGRLLADLVAAAEDCTLAGLVTEPGRDHDARTETHGLPLIGQDRMSDVLEAGCVIVDFSLAGALDGLLTQARSLGSPLVSGTTGFDASQLAALADFSRANAVVHAPNFSIGVPTLEMLLKLLARVLPQGFDAEQVETHHITKLDKPSGTARLLAETYAEVRACEPVPTHSRRQGGVIGEHTWTFSDQEETLVLTHRAHSRRAFLRGVLPAVRFAAAAGPGRYDLTDVLQGTGGIS